MPQTYHPVVPLNIDIRDYRDYRNRMRSNRPVERERQSNVEPMC
ncbi:protein of unknown function [Paraburkholderia kururiensis]